MEVALREEVDDEEGMFTVAPRSCSEAVVAVEVPSGDVERTANAVMSVRV